MVTEEEAYVPKNTVLICFHFFFFELNQIIICILKSYV